MPLRRRHCRAHESSFRRLWIWTSIALAAVGFSIKVLLAGAAKIDDMPNGVRLTLRITAIATLRIASSTSTPQEILAGCDARRAPNNFRWCDAWGQARQRRETAIDPSTEAEGASGLPATNW